MLRKLQGRWQGVAAALIAAVVAGLAVAAVVVVVQNGRGPDTLSNPRILMPEEAFYTQVSRTTDLEDREPKSKLLEVGYRVCTAIGTPGITRYSLVESIRATHWGNDVASPFVTASHTHLCPGKAYYSAPATTMAAPTAAYPTAAVGPVDRFVKPGTYRVGTDPTSQILPGEWSTEGSPRCYWARLDRETRDILPGGNGFGGGDTTRIKAGELFETRNCGTWVRIGE